MILFPVLLVTPGSLTVLHQVDKRFFPHFLAPFTTTEVYNSLQSLSFRRLTLRHDIRVHARGYLSQPRWRTGFWGLTRNLYTNENEEIRGRGRRSSLVWSGVSGRRSDGQPGGGSRPAVPGGTNVWQI